LFIRDAIALINHELRHFYRGKNVIVTGAAGTVGKAVAKALLRYESVSVVCFDNNESALFELEQDIGNGASYVLGDIRDLETLREAFVGANIVFHAAALKHVPLCERNPLEAIKTNIMGVKNVIDAASFAELDRVIYTSTDKAVNPFNVMGTSKLMGEQLISAANLKNSTTKFSTTRFGNVLGSRGSVIPIFKHQIAEGGPLTVTSKQMTRFVMTLNEAIDLLLEAGMLARGGEIFITKMHAVNILDLAEVMIDELAGNKDVFIQEIGTRPGEKLLEELMTSEEARRAFELENHYVIVPALADLYPDYSEFKKSARVVEMPYNSSVQKCLSRPALGKYLSEIGILD